MPAELRLIDASANRAREALRVIEDAARFLRDDAILAERCKTLRHDLAAALAPVLGDGRAIALRDAPGDVGTTLTTPMEAERTNVRAVVLAAGKRLTEALRAIEEYAKVLGADARTIEALRYRAYDVERSAVLAMGSADRAQWRVCVLLTESLCAHHDWRTVARFALEGGADAIQLREKDLDGGPLLDRAADLRAMTREHGAALIVNDRPDVAALVRADGVHVGQGDLPVDAVRAIVGTDALVGVSTTNLDQARAALRAGADLCGVGPMFATTTKHKPDLAGPAYLAAYLAHEPVLPPHLAIGGIAPENLRELVDIGCAGVAVSACVCSARRPDEVVRTLRAALASSASARP